MRLIANANVQNKLLLLCAIMMIGPFFVISSLILSLNGMEKSIATIYRDRVVPLKQLKLFSNGFAVQIVDATNKAATGITTKEDAVRSIQRGLALSKEQWAMYSQTYLTDEEKKLVDRTVPLYDKATALTTDITQALSNNDSSALAHIIAKRLYSEIDPLTDAIDQLVNLQLAVAEEEFIKAEESFDNQILLTVLMMTATLAVAIVMARKIIDSIAQPISELQQAAERVAGNDLDVTVHHTSNDELGSLSESFSTMILNIRGGLEALAAEKAMVENTIRLVEEQKEYLQQSVHTILESMEEFASGVMTEELHAQRNDEIGRLFSGYTRAVAQIRQALLQVRNSVEITSTAALQISAAADELSKVAQDQALQAGDISAAIEEMSSIVRLNARNASQTSQAANTAGHVAVAGGNDVRSLTEKVRQLAASMNTSAEMINKLHSTSDEIGKVIAIINEIADQTNLLALNAAIEAARAGEQGRGFAVVADEVRKLAERTTVSTKQVEETIRAMQKETSNAVVLIQQSTSEAQEGISLGNAAAESMQKIVHHNREVVDMVAQIATATEEQSSTTEQITANVDSMSSNIKQAAHSVEEIAQATSALAQQAEMLTELVSRFHLGDMPPAARNTGLVRARY